MKKEVIYLDHAAATPVDPQVYKAMQPYFADQFYNPSATYLAARVTAGAVSEARQKIAHWLGARSPEIVFTAGGTEANNLALFGTMAKYPGGHVVSSSIEHESVLKPLENLKQRESTYTLVHPKPNGVVDPEALQGAITDKTVLVSIMFANNEIGTIQPVRQVAKLVEKIRGERLKKGHNTPLYLHTDACQAANYLDLHTARLGIDMMTLNSGKIYGPKQCGALYVKTGVNIDPIILGGGQERGLRSGTENVAGIVGFATALDLAQAKRSEEGYRLGQLQKLFLELVTTQLPKTQLNGSLEHRLPNNIHLTFPGEDNERLMMALDEQGIMCATGSACSASHDDPSHVLSSIGLSEAAARASLRFTMGQTTTEAAVRKTVSTLKDLLG